MGNSCFGFKDQFRGDVLRGILASGGTLAAGMMVDAEGPAKRQTIRPVRRRSVRKGDMLKLYTGWRTPKCELLGEVQCKGTVFVTIYEDGFEFDGVDFLHSGFAETLEFANADGFESWPDLVLFFKNQYGLPFQGVMYKW
jgi:hypothetical protein